MYLVFLEGISQPRSLCPMTPTLGTTDLGDLKNILNVL